MAKLPNMTRTHVEIERRVHAALEDARDSQRDSSQFVRLSGIGKCQRELWAIRQDIPDERPPKGQTLMTFDIGNHLETAVIEWLRAADYEVMSHAPGGEQWEVEMPGGVGVGHLDGIIRWGRPSESDYRLLEIKTAKASRFDLLVEAGSYAVWNPGYADQLHGYMGATQRVAKPLRISGDLGTGLATQPDLVAKPLQNSGDLGRGFPTDQIPALNDSLVVVVCKDDSRLWSEMVRYDADRYQELVEKAELVMGSDEIVPRPPQANGQYSKFCKWCSRGAWCYSAMAGVEFDD